MRNDPTMAFREIEHMTPDYLAKAVEALAADRCPDCPRPLIITPTIVVSFPEALGATENAALSGVPVRNIREEGGRRVYRRECMACDTEWSPNWWGEAGAPGWKRQQRIASLVHMATGIHPEAKRLHDLLLLGVASANISHPDIPVMVPVMVIAPFGEGHELDDAQRAHAFNAGVLVYVPARLIGEPLTLSLSDIVPAATP